MVDQVAIIDIGAVAHLARVLHTRRANRVFLVSGQTAYQAAGGRDLIEPQLTGLVVTRFADVAPNPTAADATKIIKAFRQSDADVIVAIGGGSAIDLAKIAAAIGPLPGSIREYLTGQSLLSPSGIPVIALPTTAGSGSEATHFAVVYVDGQKYSVAAPWLQPTVAIVDPQLTYQLPAKQTAISGWDALSQAIESYWSVQATEESRQYAARAIPLLAEHIVNVVQVPTPADREAMSRGAYWAGRAINISFTTACHAVAYPMTTHFQVPHGAAVALTLPAMMRYNSGVSDVDVVDPRGAKAVQQTLQEISQLLGTTSPVQAAALLAERLQASGLATRLSTVGIITADQRATIIAEGFTPSRMNNNPRRITAADLRQMLEELA